MDLTLDFSPVIRIRTSAVKPYVVIQQPNLSHGSLLQQLGHRFLLHTLHGDILPADTNLETQFVYLVGSGMPSKSVHKTTKFEVILYTYSSGFFLDGFPGILYLQQMTIRWFLELVTTELVETAS